MAEFRVGTSGWSYKHWVGPFYPPGTRPAAFLEHYVGHFDCVELNVTFYRLPKPETVKGWARKAPEGFAFCPKLSRLITHQKKLRGVRELLERFAERLRPLEGKLGPLLVQLPPSFAFEEERVRGFAASLGEQAPGFRVALEARHPSWTEPAALELLEAYGIAWVVADSGGRFPSCEALTASFGYLRLHGPGELYASRYTGAQLAAHADCVLRWLAAGRDVWAMFNNDFAGHAVANAEELGRLVRARRR